MQGLAVTGEKPSEEIFSDGQTLMVGGLMFKPELNCLEVSIPPLHFGSKSRGRLVVGTEVFDGSRRYGEFCAEKTLFLYFVGITQSKSLRYLDYVS